MSEGEKSENKSEINQNQEKHLVLSYENERKVLLIDVEGKEEQKEMYERIAEKLSAILRDDYEGVMSKSTIADIIDATKLYPTKKVFILTSLEYMRKHYYEKIREILKNIKYQTGIAKPYQYNFIAIDQHKPSTYGLVAITTIPRQNVENIAKLILTEVMKRYDEIKRPGDAFRYTIFKKLYLDESEILYLIYDFENRIDDIYPLGEDYMVMENKYMLFIELHPKVKDPLDILLDP